MPDFSKGTVLKTTGGSRVTVKETLGEGGQGTVYRVQCDGKEYALKWYLPTYLRTLRPGCGTFYKNLSDNVSRGSPSSAFLWPLATVVTGRKSEGFGYLMELRPDGYNEFTSFIKARTKFSSTSAVLRAAINIVEAFQDLHAKGLSYQDLSPGNFFINKDTGDIMICDNDNVAPNGINLGVAGTPGYIAPEIILGTGKPDANTDLFSLSVILFELFFLSHPLDGAVNCKYPCLTQKIERELYAENPVFVMSPTHANPPVRGVHSNLIKFWPVYPAYLHEGFIRAFGEGLKQPQSRLTEREWKKLLYRMLDESLPCPQCGELNFASVFSGNTLECTECHRKYEKTFKVCVNGNEILAANGRTLNNYHINYGDYAVTVGTFVESKKTPGVYGLKNGSTVSWSVEYPDKPAVAYEPGKTVTLIPGTKITIENTTITISQ